AVGEVGIDLYWDDSRRNEQIEVFETQIEWARELGLPLCIHSRNAFDDLYACLQRCRCNELTGVFHCFSGTKEQAQLLMQMEGFVFGIGGVVTYKKSDLPDVLSVLPLERIVLETDSPYLAPVPRRGRRNESSYIPFIAQRIAEIYGTTVERVAEVTTATAERLFSI
ncbi:MAG: TatD family hydrolase, partial [Bacteroidaceae bacterium]|nr:TatD family hydrolase [Bacteroidaceae bacterium]